MRDRAVLLAVMAAVAAGLLFVALTGNGDRSVPVVAVDPVPEVSSPEQTRLSPILDAARESQPVAAVEDVKVPTTKLKGIISSSSLSAREVLEAKGTVTMEVVTDRDSGAVAVRHVELVRRSCNLELDPEWPRPIQVEVTRVMVGGEEFDVLSPLGLIAIDGEYFIIKIRRKGGRQLSVVDDLTGAHLTNVTVLRSFRKEIEEFVHPGVWNPTHRIAHGVDSPMPFDSPQHVRRGEPIPILVWSPGYAWKRAHIEPYSRRATVRLSAGAILQVGFSGATPPADSLIRLRKDDPHASIRPICEIPVDGSGTVEIRGLLPASVQVRLERGPFHRPQVLGSSTVELVPNQTTLLRLAVDEKPEVVRATLAGVLILPQSWKIEEFRLITFYGGRVNLGEQQYVELKSGELGRDPQDPDRLSFRFDDRPIGNTLLNVPELCVELEFDLPPSGREDVVLRIPEPRTLRVTTVDEETGESVPAKSLRVVRERMRTGSSISAKPTADGRFEVQVPAGADLLLSARAEGYCMQLEPVKAASGTLDVQLSMTPGQLVHLRLRGVGKGYLTIPFDWSPEEHLDSMGREQFKRAERVEDGMVIYFSTAGTYTLEPPYIPGYKQHDPIQLKGWALIRLEPE